MPQLFTALLGQAQPQLEDCLHEFFGEAPFQVVMGPCARGNDVRAHRGPYTRCKKCHLVLCGRCANGSDNDRDEWQLIQRLTERAQTNSPAYWQHPERPLPFYVMDQVKWKDEEKLLWLKQELGEDADIVEFAQAFRSLFGEKLQGDVPQKKKVLDLYRSFSPEGAAWKKESDLPPRERVEFQRVWDADAPDLCLECGKALAAGEKDYHPGCMHTGKAVVCTLAGCSGKVQVKHGVFVCTVCGNGAKMAASIESSSQLVVSDGDPLGARLKRWCKPLRDYHNCVMGFSTAADPEHTPAWKKQRRS